MENPSSSSAAVLYMRLHVWSFALACAITALLLGLIAWPIHAMMMARAAVKYGAYRGPWHNMAGPHAPMMMHHGFGAWHLLIFMVAAGVGGAILAALYNAFAVRR